MKHFISGADQQFYTDSQAGMEDGWTCLPASILPGASLATSKIFHIPEDGQYTLQYRMDSRFTLQITEPIAHALPWRRGQNAEQVLYMSKGYNRICAQIRNISAQPLSCNLTTRLLDSRGQLLYKDICSPLPDPEPQKSLPPLPDLTGYTPAAGAAFASCGRFGYAKGDGLLDYSMPAFGIVSRPFVSGHPKYRKNLLWSFSLLPAGEIESGELSGSYHVPSNESVTCDWTHTHWTRHLPDGHYLSFDYSVIAPALLIETDLKELTLSRLEGIGSFQSITLPLYTKALTRKAKNCLFYDSSTDGTLSQNWILLSHSGQFPEVPVLLNFHTAPVRIIRTEEAVKLCFDTPIQWAMLSFPCGIQLYESYELTEQWYADTVARCVTAHSQNLARPVACREYFQCQEDSVSILNAFEFRYFQDSVNTPQTAFAPLPPPLILASDSVSEISYDKSAVSMAHPTKYGPLFGVANSRISTYRLPVPKYRNEFPLAVPEPDRLKQLLHSDFADYLHYHQDMREIKNPGNYSFLFQYALVAQLFPVLHPQDYEKLLCAMREGLAAVCNPDFYYTGPNGRRCFSWYQRTEPFTGVSYYSTYLHVSNIQRFSHCDREVIENSDQTFIEVDWGNAMSLYSTWLAALFTGSWEQIRKHWHIFRKAFDYYLVTMDWACMTAAYAETGITWNDGTNYGGYLGFLNMADLLGIEPDRQLALYAYAKMNAMRMGLFVSSQKYFCKYFGVEPWYTTKFFHEETDASYAFQSYPENIVKNHYRGQSLYNLTTEGHYSEAMRMYAEYLPVELEKVLHAAEGATQEDGLTMTCAVEPPLEYHSRLCNFLGQQETYTYFMLNIFLDRYPEDTLKQMIGEASANMRLSREILGSSASRRRVPAFWTYTMLLCALKGASAPRITAWKSLHIQHACYPIIEVLAEEGAWLEVVSQEQPQAILQDQPLVFFHCGKNLWRTQIFTSGTIIFSDRK